MADKLKLTVDDSMDVPAIRSALPLPGLSDVPTKVVELGADILSSAIGSTLSAIYRVIADLPPAPEGHELSEVRFKLAIDAKGEVSLLTAVKGGISGQSGIEFTLTRSK